MILAERKIKECFRINGSGGIENEKNRSVLAGVGLKCVAFLTSRKFTEEM